jgi:hypothetical protein
LLYLEEVEDSVLAGNTEEIFNESFQHFYEYIHFPAQAATVTHQIAFGPNTGQSVRPLKSQMSLWLFDICPVHPRGWAGPYIEQLFPSLRHDARENSM